MKRETYDLMQPADWTVVPTCAEANVIRAWESILVHKMRRGILLEAATECDKLGQDLAATHLRQKAHDEESGSHQQSEVETA